MDIKKDGFKDTVLTDKGKHLQVVISAGTESPKFDYSFYSTYNYAQSGYKQIKVMEGKIMDTNKGIYYSVDDFVPDNMYGYTHFDFNSNKVYQKDFDATYSTTFNPAKAFQDTINMIKDYLNSPKYKKLSNKKNRLSAINFEVKKHKDAIKALETEKKNFETKESSYTKA